MNTQGSILLGQHGEQARRAAEVHARTAGRQRIHRAEMLGYDSAGQPIWSISGGSRMYLVQPIPPIHTVDGAAFNTFTTFQSITPAPDVTLAASLLEVGSELHLEADGEFSNTGTPTLGLGFLLGATTLAAGTAITTTTGATSWPWHAEANMRVRVVGASGTASVHVMGWWMIGTSLTAFSTVQAMPATLALRTVASGIDTGTALAPKVGAVWGTSSASNTIKVNRFAVDLRS
jgi:hypothetical protein